ncbi:hypothetical protein [Hydrogenophaga palleronii]|uniref:hypothetical protein n=1 Tax=Hydrogenophaga palleronii TaxID=65655 RepID=UPI00082504C4|nr:hypothetical protein [Hydrogenophaga palleronii]
MHRARFCFALCAGALSLGLAACANSEKISPPPPAAERSPIVCTQDVLQCPDGRFVRRTPPGCVFVCPAASTKAHGVR